MSHSHDASVADDELKPSTTEGYKVGEKKTLDEYTQLDANDESLAVSGRQWKKKVILSDVLIVTSDLSTWLAGRDGRQAWALEPAGELTPPSQR